MLLDLCNVADAHFDEKIALRDLENYRKKRPGPTARLLRDMLVDTRAVDGMLLDVGSGTGGLTSSRSNVASTARSRSRHRPRISLRRPNRRHTAI